MANPVKERLKAGRPAIGHWIDIPSAAVAEMLAGAGMDWLLIDTEHGPMDTETVEHLIRAIEPTPVVPLVRVAGNDPVLIKRALDRGAYGILVPLVSTPEEAQAAVAACKYPPEGIRGIAGTRASRYGRDVARYFEEWNRDVLVVVQIETRQALENVERIAAVPGVDVLFVGPNDLSASLGLFRRFEDPAFQAAVARVLKAARDHGIAAGYMAKGAEAVLEMVRQGFQFVAAGSDVGLLTGAAQELYRRIGKGLAELGNERR